MKFNKKIIVVLLFIIGIAGLLVGSIAYYRIVVSGSIEGSTGNAVFVLRDSEAGESWNNKVISLGQINPGDSGSFDVVMDASGSTVDMYATLSIDRGSGDTELPTNLKFYTTSDHKSELHKYYSFLEKSGSNKETLTIYWYWNPYIDDVEDTKYINKSFNASINVSAVQISEYAMMKNGYSEAANGGTAFWQDAYKPYIRTITFGNDLSNLPSSCTEENLCWDISESTTQKKKVYAYLIDSGLKDEYETEQSLYNLYIVSEAPIFAPIDSTSVFSSFTNLKSINFNDNFNTSKVTNMQDMFYNNSILENIDVNNFNTKNVTNMGGMFSKCSSLLKLDLSNFNTENLTLIHVEEYRKNRSIFSSCSSLIEIDLSSFNTKKITQFGSSSSANGLFSYCSSLTNLDLSSFDTSNVINMYSMFYGCSSLTTLNLNGFNTSKVTNMKYMFGGCSSLKELNLSSFNTSSVTDMYGMFQNCSSLISLDLSNFNTLNVTNMHYMFSGCSSLTSLDLSLLKKFKYIVSNGLTIFQNCTSLESLNLRSLTEFAGDNVNIFGDLDNLKYLDISSLYITSGMFIAHLDKLVTTINYIGSYSENDIPTFNTVPKPSQGKITINYEAKAEPYLDQIIAAHPEYNWVKGKLITAPTSS